MDMYSTAIIASQEYTTHILLQLVLTNKQHKRNILQIN